MAEGRVTVIDLDRFELVGKQHVSKGVSETLSKRQNGEAVAIEDSKVYRSFKPIRVVMTIFGLYHDRKRKGGANKIHDTTMKGKRQRKRKVSFLEIYSSFAVFYIWVHFILHGLVAFDGNESVANPRLYYKIMFAVWDMIAVLQVTFCFCACRYRLPSFWRECAQLESDLPSVMEAIQLEIRTKIAVVLVIIFSVLNITYGVFVISNGLMPVFFYSPFHYVVDFRVPSAEVTVLMVYYAMSGFYVTLTALLPYAIYTFFCILFYTMFKAFNDEFKEEVQQALVTGEPLRVEFHRRRHLKLCKLFDIAGGMFSFFVAYVLVLNTGLCCLVCYMLIYHFDTATDSPIDVMALMTWAVLSVVQLGIISAGAAVNDQAHAPLLELNEAQLDIIPDSQSIPMFLNKLSVTPIGFSALGMFTIDKPTILTWMAIVLDQYFRNAFRHTFPNLKETIISFQIIGMFLTYFFLMIQFKPSDIAVPCVGNFTIT